jgi:Icc-related predicted phosphoesterase
MNAMFISDTHGQHEDVLLPHGNMIIHAGNITKNGTPAEAVNFLQWFARLKYNYKIFIAGTHDHFFENEPALAKRLIPAGVIYLEESGVEIGGLKIWGSPYNSFNHGSAFSRPEDKAIGHWEKIPDDSDMVIIHTPAYGVLDENANGEHEGSKDLLRKLIRVEPRYFVCGHRPSTRGYEYRYGIHFINASVTNDEFKIAHKPVFQWYP